MANLKISQLPPASALTGDEIFAVVQDGTTKKATYNSVKIPGAGGSGLGWARYDDDEYTELAPLTLTDGVPVTLPNNSANVINTYINSSIEFYDSATQKIQVENEGDVYVQTIVFKASATNANQSHLHVYLTSTGATPYERVIAEVEFPKGNTIAHDEHLVFQYYADADFVANGNQWTLRADTGGGTCDVWDIIYFIQRTQNHG